MSIKYPEIYNRFKEVCPLVQIGDYTDEELKLAVVVAFKIIGYPPKEMEASIITAQSKHLKSTMLYEFIYTVYEVDNEV